MQLRARSKSNVKNGVREPYEGQQVYTFSTMYTLLQLQELKKKKLYAKLKQRQLCEEQEETQTAARETKWGCKSTIGRS